MKISRMFITILFLGGMGSAVWAQGDVTSQYMQAGNAALAAKNYDQAIAYYQAVVNANPNNAGAYQGLGNCYYFKGDQANALSNYQKALNLNPNNPQLSQFVQTLQARAGAPASSPASNTPAASTSPATGAVGSPAASKFELDVNAGLALDSSQVGFGGGVGGFFPLSKNFLLGANVNFYTFSEGESASGDGVTISASGSINFLEAMVTVKYKFDGTNMKPYLFAGGGIADVMESASASGSGDGGSASASASASAIDPMFAIGGGLAFPAGKDMDIVVQAKESIILVPGTTVTEDTPEGEVSVSGGGGTESYTVIEGGLNFNL
jgi:Tetratricopeptide repeat